jgi:hypothetical protein
MLKFEITYKSSFCVQWPRIQALHNGVIKKDILCDQSKFLFEIEPQDNNNLTLQWVNKSEKHTKTYGGKIVQDQTFELLNIRIDGMQIEEWFWTDTYYTPRYFHGFLKQYKEQRRNEHLAEKIKSQLVWHFPGTFTFTPFPLDFWGWYFKLKQDKEVIKFLDKDPDRVHKFRGSLDPCFDLVNDINKFL